jgi:hypothetical protein
LALEVLEVLVMQMRPHHKMVQILFLTPPLQRAAVEVIMPNKMEEPEAQEVVVEGQPLLLEAAVLGTHLAQARHKVTMAAMQSLTQAVLLVRAVEVVVREP